MIEGGEGEVGFTVDVDDGNGLQALSIIGDGGGGISVRDIPFFR